MKKPLLLAVPGLGLILALLLATRVPLDLGHLQGATDALQSLRETHRTGLAVLAFAAYVAATALSLPVGVWLTLAMGALFGFWQGLVLVSFASTIGATLAFLTARHLARDRVLARLGTRAAPLEQGLRRDGAFYLFSLRLIPVVPFFAVNLLMGLTPIRAWVFYLVSQLGMLPGTAVYVNAGTQLAGLTSVKGLISPGLLASFALLGLFPWMARLALTLFRRDPARPRRFDRNLIVIGGGSAGLVSAYIAAAVKAKVTLVEAHRMGGDCLNTGCVPSKALIRSAKLAHQMRKADHWGLTPADPPVPFDAVMGRVHRIIAEIAPHDSVERYTGLGVEVLQGYARLVDPWTVDVTFPDGGTRRLTTRAVIVATGAEPILPDLPGLDQTGALTSDTLWEALRGRATIPGRIAILGGGPIGCELAQALQRLGSQVTLIQRGPRLLPREDEDASALVRAALETDGVRVLTGQQATACGKGWLQLGSGERIAFDELIVALGRRPRLTGFGLESLGIGGAKIEADAFLRTRHPHILVAGDVAGLYQFTHTAAHQAWFAAVNALFGDLKRFRADYRAIPRATFTDPEVARVGLSEAEARAQGIAHEVTRYGLDDLDRAIADGAAEGFIKVLTPPGKDRILGVTIVGDHAGDLLSEFVLAMKHGLGLGKILSTVHAYPTWAEAAKATAGRWRQAHVSPLALRLLERFHRWRRG